MFRRQILSKFCPPTPEKARFTPKPRLIRPQKHVPPCPPRKTIPKSCTATPGLGIPAEKIHISSNDLRALIHTPNLGKSVPF